MLRHAPDLDARHRDRCAHLQIADIVELRGQIVVRGTPECDAAAGGLRRQEEQRREAEQHEGSRFRDSTCVDLRIAIPSYRNAAVSK